ncbi:endo-1,4-beta-xylanase 1 [Fusarium bulbicola]|nr:endo-1,4-beta-xylanase 1 [Fusarium bulbicola]
MVSFKSLLLAASALTGALARPFDFLDEQDDGNSTSILEARQVTGNSEGYHNGYFYSWWSDGGGYANYQMGEGSHYTNPGTGRTINYGGSFSPQGNGYLCVYGWTRNPLVEYYVIENYGTYNPGSAGQHKGTVYNDGDTHDLYQTTRYQQPSIDGTQTFNQYWVIRRASICHTLLPSFSLLAELLPDHDEADKTDGHVDGAEEEREVYAEPQGSSDV